MKKIFVLAIMAMFTLASQAQIVSSRSSRITTTTTQGLYEDYNTIYLQWNPSSFSSDKMSSKSFNGFSAGYNHAFSLSQALPLYVEAGLGAQFSIWSDEIDDVDVKIHMVSAKIPVSFSYKWDIPNSSFSIIPNVGLDFRFNIVGKFKIDYPDEYLEYYGKNVQDSYNLFDKDDMDKIGKVLVGDKDTWNRFQVGWHIGVNFMYNNTFMLGASYGTDFSEIAKDCKIRTGSITLGYCF